MRDFQTVFFNVLCSAACWSNRTCLIAMIALQNPKKLAEIILHSFINWQHAFWNAFFYLIEGKYFYRASFSSIFLSLGHEFMAVIGFTSVPFLSFYRMGIISVKLYWQQLQQQYGKLRNFFRADLNDFLYMNLWIKSVTFSLVLGPCAMLKSGFHSSAFLSL